MKTVYVHKDYQTIQSKLLNLAFDNIRNRVNPLNSHYTVHVRYRADYPEAEGRVTIKHGNKILAELVYDGFDL